MPKQRKPIRVEMPEVMWLGENRDFLEENYPGKWVAVKGRYLIAVGDNPREVRAEAQSNGIEHPVMSGVRAAEYRGILFVGTRL